MPKSRDGLEGTAPHVVGAVGQLKGPDVGVLDALGGDCFAGLGKSAIALLLRRLIAGEPRDPRSRAWVRARRAPPGPSLPHRAVHMLLTREGCEHADERLDSRNVPWILMRVVW